MTQLVCGTGKIETQGCLAQSLCSDASTLHSCFPWEVVGAWLLGRGGGNADGSGDAGKLWESGMVIGDLVSYSG